MNQVSYFGTIQEVASPREITENIVDATTNALHHAEFERMNRRKLVLLDIDGTLLTTNGRGRVAFRTAIDQALNRTFDASQVSFSGKTDPQILAEILDVLQPPVGSDNRFHQVLNLYEKVMLAGLRASDVRILPGVKQLLAALAEKPNILMGLLTGNLETTAYRKLTLAGLDSYFSFGAFGSDHRDRDSLAAIALERARQVSGHAYSGRDVIIIGDTVHDIQCARAVSARSVAVCTGMYSRDDLTRLEPDVLLDDLSQTDRVISAMLAND